MKKTFVSFLVLIFICSSCSFNDDNQPNFYFQTLEVVSADFPEVFEYGKIYRINVEFKRPSDCHFFEGFEFERPEQTERIVYGIGSVIDKETCNDLTDTTIESHFDFEVLYTNTYTFKLWAGENENNEDEYLIIEVPVEQ